jgi:hypothetical protein
MEEIEYGIWILEGFVDAACRHSRDRSPFVVFEPPGTRAAFWSRVTMFRFGLAFL